MINEDIAKEILHQLFSSLEALETQCAAILQFLKDKGIASEKELTVHFEQAGTASNVRWRAARVRIDHLISSALKPAEQESPKSEPPKSSEDKQVPPVTTGKTTSMKRDADASSKRESEKETPAAQKRAASGKSEAKEEQQLNASAGNRNKENDRTSKSPKHATKGDSSEDAPSRKSA